MSVDAVGGPTGIAVPAPAPTDRAPHEAARNAAGKSPTQESAQKAAQQAAQQAAQKAAERDRRAQPTESVEPLKGLSMPEMLVLLGMHPVSPAEAARAEVEAERTARTSGFDTYV